MNKIESRIWNIEYRIFLVLVPLVFLAASCNKNQPQPVVYKTGIAVIAGHTLNVQVADTEALRAKGLGDRNSLAQDDGMLFAFPAIGRYAFWMKGMKFNLDFIWIKAGKIVEITSNAPAEPGIPDASLHSYLPAEEVDSVIEVNAGWTAKNKVKVGDAVSVDEKR